jgi:hypothetical protein
MERQGSRASLEIQVVKASPDPQVSRGEVPCMSVVRATQVCCLPGFRSYFNKYLRTTIALVLMRLKLLWFSLLALCWIFAEGTHSSSGIRRQILQKDCPCWRMNILKLSSPGIFLKADVSFIIDSQANCPSPKNTQVLASCLPALCSAQLLWINDPNHSIPILTQQRVLEAV